MVALVVGMQLIATAGHGDHGKSTLLQALTGMDPHRGEEQPGGPAAEPGYAWLTLPSGGRLAFIDVPGHERALPNMIAAIGPVPAVLFVVAADQGWRAQSAEHLAVIDALGVRHGLLVVTRADLADPGPALAEAGQRIAASSLGETEALAVSAVTGQGIPALVDALGRLADSLPVPDPAAPVRLWVDHVSRAVQEASEEGHEEGRGGGWGTGSGTAVVTGTMPAGTVRVGDELVVTPAMRPVRVQGIEALGEPVSELTGPARASLSLRGVSHERLGKGMALVQPGRWTLTDVIDVRLAAPAPAPAGPDAAGKGAPRLPRTVTVHAGPARTVARVRMLSDRVARLSWREAIPLHVGDRLLLRDHGDRGERGERGARARPPRPTDLALAHAGGSQAGGTYAAGPAPRGVVALDVAPPSLGRRGAGASAAELESWPDPPAAADLLRRHGLLRASALLAMGISDHPEPVAGEWLADPGHWADLAGRLGEAVTAQAAREPMAPGLTVEAARTAVGLPDRRLVDALVRPPLRLRDGLVQVMAGPVSDAELPAAVAAAVKILLADLATAPFASPDADRLRHLGLDLRAIAAAERAGLLLRVSDQIVLAPGADALAGRVLAGLPQPFTAAEARQALQTTRRVAIPLLEFLDRAGVTQRLPDDRRRLVRPPTD